MAEQLRGELIVSSRGWGQRWRQVASDSCLKQGTNGNQLTLSLEVGLGRFTQTDMEVLSDARTASFIKKLIQKEQETVRD